MLDLLISPGFWAALFSVTLIQVALGADNLIIITVLANKLPPQKQARAIQVGLVLAMLFRIILLALVSWMLAFATEVFLTVDRSILPGIRLEAAVSGKALVLAIGGLILIWKGIKELRIKAKGIGDEGALPHIFGGIARSGNTSPSIQKLPSFGSSSKSPP